MRGFERGQLLARRGMLALLGFERAAGLGQGLRQAELLGLGLAMAPHLFGERLLERSDASLPRSRLGEEPRLLGAERLGPLLDARLLHGERRTQLIALGREFGDRHRQPRFNAPAR